MTDKETSAPLLERIRERVDRARKAVTRTLNAGSERQMTMVSPAYVGDLAAALDLVTIELAQLRRELEELRRDHNTHAHYEPGEGP